MDLTPIPLTAGNGTIFRGLLAELHHLAMTFSVVGVSQLYHAHSNDSIPQIMLNALILGCGFLCGGLACHAISIALGGMIEFALNTSKRYSDRRSSEIAHSCPARTE